MLEVINGYLMVYFVVLCTLNALLPSIVKPVAACFSRPSNQERTIWEEILKLKAEQKIMSIKDEFAAYSKLQRKINKLEAELKDNSQSRMSKNIAIKSSVQIALQVVLALVMVVSVIWFRRVPIVALKGNLFPLTTILRYPSEMPNAISTHVWVLISNISIKTLLKPLTS
ncbi:guided entry of tail-anchored proteins factor 1 [Manduca sexta]|uniref:guided entry of tail-anchored proteins factor 1 n=1 Tax=Manduca sexta TaxID=7130 RepID=UPI001184540A|nr:guided entry of tail-anchored proteins factor 1 [Manduca sexta]